MPNVLWFTHVDHLMKLVICILDCRDSVCSIYNGHIVPTSANWIISYRTEFTAMGVPLDAYGFLKIELNPQNATELHANAAAGFWLGIKGFSISVVWAGFALAWWPHRRENGSQIWLEVAVDDGWHRAWVQLGCSWSMLGFMTNSMPSATNAVFNHLCPRWLFNKQTISTEKLTRSHAPHANFLRKWDRKKEKNTALWSSIS